MHCTELIVRSGGVEVATVTAQHPDGAATNSRAMRVRCCPECYAMFADFCVALRLMSRSVDSPQRPRNHVPRCSSGWQRRTL